MSNPSLDSLAVRTTSVLIVAICHLVFVLPSHSFQQGTLTPSSGAAPANFEQLWEGFDPRAEPLETEVLKQWEEEEVVLRVVRFRIGQFKGQVSRLVGIYGFPKKQAGKIPGLLQIHGGGQYADYRACLTNARRGYATLSISWAGRINAPGYKVNPEVVKLFFGGETDDPQYLETTDWAALDGYHAPTRFGGNFLSTKPHRWTIDTVPSPRNSPWFLCALAARRGLTFLERQPQVNAQRLGVYGHSMGGKLTVMAATDSRVKACAPSCGGISDIYSTDKVFQTTLQDDVSLKKIACPIFFLSPSNDFHGRIGDLPAAVGAINSKQWRVTCSPHMNHKDTAEYAVATQLWFDHHLKGTFQTPSTPQTELKIDSRSKITFDVSPEVSDRLISVDVFYTQGGKQPELPGDLNQAKTRFWHHVSSTRRGDQWTTAVELETLDKPLWIYANATYRLDQPISGAGYYYASYTADKFVLSSLLEKVGPEQLTQSNCKPTMEPQSAIEDFEAGWERDWIVETRRSWSYLSHKLSSPIWKPTPDSKLEIQVRSKQPGKLVVRLGEQHASIVDLSGDNQWQTFQLEHRDFLDFDGQPLESFASVNSIQLSPTAHMDPKRGSKEKRRVVGQPWKGDLPEFRLLRWTTPAPK